ncbi:MAG: hypothetical protein E7211_17905 [Clostridium lundense]|nr:hypothetical protein [Clostridium lundense]
MQKWYKYKCNKCGWEEGWIEEGNLLKRIGCGCCCTPTRAVVEGINDIPTTASWMVKYFQGGYDEARRYSKSSNQKIYPICYDCGRVKTKAISINQLYGTHSIGCSCGDGISYPQKLMFKVLEQLEVKFETEYSPSWITPKKYDFYFEINNKKYIIEMDGGLGHGRKVHSKSKLTIKETLEIDEYKDKMAKGHSIKVIRINCKESDLSYIKNNILNSELSNLFDLNKIDWNKIEEFALINLVKVVCDHKKNNPDITTREIGKVMNLDRSTILIYLKKGNKLGWCNYSAKEESFKGSSKAGKMKGKQVEVFKDGKSLGIFESCSELERQSEELFGVKLLQSAISPTCNRKFKQYKGYTFRYIDE